MIKHLQTIQDFFAPASAEAVQKKKKNNSQEKK